MWDHEAYRAKAQAYFTRAGRNPNGDEFIVWSILGVELLARAALAKVSPVLNAAMDGPSILDSLGYPDPNGKQAKSVPMHTVLARLPVVVEEFTPDRVAEFEYLMELRNAELHTAVVRLDEPVSNWLPKLVRAIAPLATHLGVTVGTLLGEEVAELGQSYVDADDKKVLQDVRTRINAARQFWDRLTTDEQTARLPQVRNANNRRFQLCPACKCVMTLQSSAIRSSPSYIDEDGDRVTKVEYVVTGGVCQACGLELGSTAEVRSAGLAQAFHEIEIEEAYVEREPEYVDDEYGND
ncbi:hypothetical protein [Microbacterium sp. TWP3-1-2b2]|uniref:hypothetical protein n=1 Tax=Microbacterium sp. TWP3-1-2b2 TaxID=2804651 RepID=UPI003CEA4ECF